MKKSLVFTLIILFLSVSACKKDPVPVPDPLKNEAVKLADEANPAGEANPAVDPATNDPVGRVLQLKDKPAGVELKRSVDPTGVYRIDEFIDGMVVLGTARLISLPNEESDISKAVMNWEYEPYDIIVAQDEEYTKKMSHPVWKIIYHTGHNEDMKANRDYLIKTDKFDYRVHTAVSVDFEEDYKEKIDTWVSGMELVEK